MDEIQHPKKIMASYGVGNIVSEFLAAVLAVMLFAFYETEIGLNVAKKISKKVKKVELRTYHGLSATLLGKKRLDGTKSRLLGFSNTEDCQNQTLTGQ